MTRDRKRKARASRAQAPPQAGRARALVVLGIALVALVLVVATWRSSPAPVVVATPSGAASATAGHPPAAGPPAASAATASATPPQFRPLLGEWLRPDGGYVLSVTSIAPDGRAAVGYLNPRPIRVARAQARQEGSLVGLFVEFDDVNYRGSTYNLGYDAASGQLKGIYYQATQRQQYDVSFVRER